MTALILKLFDNPVLRWIGLILGALLGFKVYNEVSKRQARREALEEMERVDEKRALEISRSAVAARDRDRGDRRPAGERLREAGALRD